MVSESHLSDILLSVWSEDSRARLSRLLDVLPADVGAYLRTRAADGSAASFVFSALKTLEVCLEAGMRPLQMLGDSAFRCESPSGQHVAVIFRTSRFLAPGVGASSDLTRLLRSVTVALDRWRYALHVRRPLPAGFDSTAISRAVQLWRLAMERGDWRGRHAIYEDDGLAVELSVVDKPSADRPGGLILGAAPLLAADRLAAICEDFAETLASIEVRSASGSDGAGLPIIGAWVSAPRWGLSRGHVLERLYGRAVETSTEWDGSVSQFTAWYQGESLALFADPSWQRVASVWLLDDVSCAAHDNPWGLASSLFSSECDFPGRCFVKVDGTGPSVAMSWREAESEADEELAEPVAGESRTP